MFPDREGLFHAYPLEIGVNETGPNKLATAIIKFRLFEELVQGAWVDCLSQDMEIMGYFYLECRDGSLNNVALDGLKAALGWDGRDPFWLQETDLSEHPVQVKLDVEVYNGRSKIRVQYLNPYGATGGGAVSKADEATKTAIRNRLGSKLRSLAGPAPASQPAASSDQPPVPKAPPQDEQKTNQGRASMEDAWDAFCGVCSGDKWTRDEIEKEWFRIIAELFPGKQPDELSTIEWAVMRDEGPGKIIPF